MIERYREVYNNLYTIDERKELVAEAIEANAKEGKMAAMIMIDLDHFKDVNDTFGHAAGDKLLEDVGKVLNDSFKGRDIVGRMGGDEFMVFMYDIKGVQDAETIAKKLNVALRREYGDSASVVNISCSIGIAMCDIENGDCFEKAYKRADSALYVSKENGRDCYTIYDDSMSE